MKIKRINQIFPRLAVLQSKFDMTADEYRAAQNGIGEVPADVGNFLVGAGFCEEVIEKPKIKIAPGGDKHEVDHGDHS